MTDLKLNLKRIDPVKYALIIGLLMAFLAFIMIAIAMLFGSLFGYLGEPTELNTTGLGVIMGGGIIMLFIAPAIYFVFGFIFGLLATSLLNFILKKTGGLPLNFDKTEVTISKNE